MLYALDIVICCMLTACPDQIFVSFASDSDGSYLWDSAYNSSICLDLQQPDKHVFIGLLQLSGADGSGPIPRILPTQPGAQESQRGEIHL